MRHCGREFQAAEIELIRQLLAVQPPLDRARLSREVCQRLGWRRSDGRLKDMSPRVAMLKMQADGLFALPPPRTAKPPAYRAHPGIERTVQPPPIVPSVDLAGLRLEVVSSRADSLLWNTYTQRHQYLGHQPLRGRSYVTSPAVPLTSSPCSASVPVPGKPSTAMRRSAGLPSNARATCTPSSTTPGSLFARGSSTKTSPLASRLPPPAGLLDDCRVRPAASSFAPLQEPRNGVS